METDFNIADEQDSTPDGTETLEISLSDDELLLALSKANGYGLNLGDFLVEAVTQYVRSVDVNYTHSTDFNTD